MHPILAFLLARLREPSTVAGLSVFGAMLGIAPGVIDATAQVVVAAAGLAAAVIPDPKK